MTSSLQDRWIHFNCQTIGFTYWLAFSASTVISSRQVAQNCEEPEEDMWLSNERDCHDRMDGSQGYVAKQAETFFC